MFETKLIFFLLCGKIIDKNKNSFRFCGKKLTVEKKLPEYRKKKLIKTFVLIFG